MKNQLMVRKNKNKEKKNKTYLYGINTKEEKIIKKSNHRFIKYLFFGGSVIILVLLVSGLINIFTFIKSFFKNETLGNIVGGSVEGIILFLLLIFVIRPVVQALSLPQFTLDAMDDNQKVISRKNFKKMQKVAHNIIETNDNVSDDNKNLLRTFIHNKKELNHTLKDIYQTDIKKDINKTINNHACQVLIATALSQNSKFDTLSVFFINTRMIMQICVKCGYHPTYPRLAKLIVKVYRNALISYVLQATNFQDIIINGIDKLVKGAISIVPGVKEITSSLTQGAANALLTLRIGILTRKYLYEEYSKQEKITQKEDIEVEIVEASLNEANENIDSIIKLCKDNVKEEVKV